MDEKQSGATETAGEPDAPEVAPDRDEEEGASSDEGPESWAPWGALSELQETVGGIVDTALRSVSSGGARFPRYDLIAVGELGYRVLVDLPGLEKGDVDLKIADRDLIIAGERPRPQLGDEGRVERSERPYGRFRRTIRIPDDADAGGIGAKMTNGVLDISLPLRAPAEAQKIEVD